MADTILSGAFDGDFDVALERSAAFCRIVALGQTHHADAAEPPVRSTAPSSRCSSHLLVKTAEDLEAPPKPSTGRTGLTPERAGPGTVFLPSRDPPPRGAC